MRRVTVLALAGGLSAILTGCTAFGLHSSEPTVPPTPSSTPTAAKEVVVAAPDGVMASGTLISRRGDTSARFQIINAAGKFTLSISGFHSSVKGELLTAISDSTIPAGACGDFVRFPVQVGDPYSRDGSLSVTDLWAQSNDPSFLTTVAIMEYPPGNGGCEQSILATGHIALRIPETHPDIAVVDHGVSYSAWGTDTKKDGKPSTYLTHQGDDWTHREAV